MDQCFSQHLVLRSCVGIVLTLLVISRPLPLNMSPPSHSQGTIHSTQSLLGGPGRDSYPPPLNHAPPRIPFSGHPNVHESMSRPPYPPRAVENPVTSTYSPTALYSHQNNTMMLDATGRQDQSASGAPPFGATQEHCLIYNSNRDKVKPDIQARIHKGFFKVDDKWTCYRRNYFSVQCSFSLQPPQVNSQLYVHRSTSSGLEPIQSFVVTISAVVNGNGVDGDTLALIQHTPKRSKETEEAPKKIRINPIPPNHGLNQNGTSGSMPYSFGGLPQLNGTKQDYDTTYGSGNQGSHNSTSHTFERIQFQRATANNGKRRAQQQYYHVVVELYAEVARSSDTSAFGTLLKIATKLSAPMVVRGCSPAQYKDSSTSGIGGDGLSGRITPAARPLQSPARAANPPLIRTSTLKYSPNSSSSIPLAQAAQAFNPYAMDPRGAVLKSNGNLDTIADHWGMDEWDAKRRLVEFTRRQTGNTIHTEFKSIAPEDYTSQSIYISCIWWEEKNECYVTSVDTIYLLESLVAVRCTIEEKNRIRRNLESFRPLTVSKAKPESEKFFKVISWASPTPSQEIPKRILKCIPGRI